MSDFKQEVSSQSIALHPSVPAHDGMVTDALFIDAQINAWLHAGDAIQVCLWGQFAARHCRTLEIDRNYWRSLARSDRP